MIRSSNLKNKKREENINSEYTRISSNFESEEEVLYSMKENLLEVINIQKTHRIRIILYMTI